VPEMTIATDAVDESMIQQPRKMDMAFIKRFMIVFGILSSLFDYITFGVLLYVLHAGVKEFRTGWFVESVASAALVVLIVRTSLPVYKSKPGKYLTIATFASVAVTVILTFTPLADILGMQMLPGKFYGLLACIIFLYLACAETAKRIFYTHASKHSNLT
jgi:Mg2+-importing ATPase